MNKICFKPTIICIVGPSGSGKTTLARFLELALDIPMLVSYTTRPQRQGEIQGVDHWFVDEDDIPAQEEMLAYTYFGGHHYWMLTKDVPHTDPGICTYVIDEKGLKMLLDNYSEQFSIIGFLIKRSKYALIRQVGEERVMRDLERITIPDEEYQEVIYNYGPLETFLAESVQRIRKYLK